MGQKTPAENRIAWKTWYNYKNSKGEFVNRYKYLKKKLIRKIGNGKNVKLITLRSYGLLDYMTKHGTKKQKEILKEELQMEKAVYSEPQPLIVPEIDYSTKNPYIPQPYIPEVVSVPPIIEQKQDDTDDLPENIFDDYENGDFPDDEVEEQPTTADFQTLPENLSTNKKIAAKTIQKRDKEILKKVKLPKNFKFTLADARRVFYKPNLESKNTIEKYAKDTPKKYFNRLSTLVVKVMGCKDPKRDIKSCLSNPRTVIKRLLTIPNPKFKGRIGYSKNSIKDYINPIIVLARLDANFRTHLGKKAFDAYHKDMVQLMNEVSDKQKELVVTALEIKWEDIEKIYEKTKKKYNELKAKIIKKNRKVRDLTQKEKIFLTDALLLFTPYLAIPKRDNWSLKIVDYKPKAGKEGDENYYVVKNKLIILNSYKTKKIYGRKEYLLQLGRTNDKNGDELGKILNQSLKMWKRDFLITKTDGTEYKDGKLSSRLADAMKRLGLQDKNPNKTKGKPDSVTYNNFRHSFVSWARGKKKNGKARYTPDEKRKIATYDMLHSTQTQDIYDRIISREMLDEE